MIGIHIYGAAIRMLVMVSLSIMPPQAAANRPRTINQLKEFWQYDRANIENEIKAFGVDFELDYPREQELRTLGMPQTLLNLIKSQIKTGTITVQCEPVECQVSINDEAVGSTFASVLTKSQVMAGAVKVKVTAPNVETQIADVQLSAGQHLNIPKFTMEAPKGALNVTCDPVDCSLHISGPNGFVRIATTAQHRFSMDNLSAGQYEVQAQAAPYNTETAKIFVTAGSPQPLDFKLKINECASWTPLQVFDRVVDSLGGKRVLTIGATSKNIARMSLTGDPPTIGAWKAQVVESAAINRLRWDLKIAGSNWTVIFDSSTAYSKGEKKYLGTEFAQELEQSIRLFSALRLPSILPVIRGKTDIKHICGETEVTMLAESPDDRYTFHLNKDFSPLKLLHEHLTVPRSREEIEFGQYKPTGQNLVLPHVMILRYPDRAKHEQIFEYDTMDLGAQIKDSVFKP